MQALFLRHEGYLGAIGAFLKGAEEDSKLLFHLKLKKHTVQILFGATVCTIVCVLLTAVSIVCFADVFPCFFV